MTIEPQQSQAFSTFGVVCAVEIDNKTLFKSTYPDDMQGQSSQRPFRN